MPSVYCGVGVHDTQEPALWVITFLRICSAVFLPAFRRSSALCVCECECAKRMGPFFAVEMTAQLAKRDPPSHATFCTTITVTYAQHNVRTPHNITDEILRTFPRRIYARSSNMTAHFLILSLVRLAVSSVRPSVCRLSRASTHTPLQKYQVRSRMRVCVRMRIRDGFYAPARPRPDVAARHACN